ncbi:prohead protease/major capsid protein fusion protein (plasmid) [Segnochrobactraceae bacterium EtOH-i3]
MPADMRRALGAIAPASLDAAAGTVEAVIATATPVRRRDPAGPFDEVLVISPSAVRLDRLNAGAPVLDSHAAWSLADQIGAVIPGSARIENGQVVARLALTARPERAGIVADIRAGIIKNVSAGYRVIATEQEDVPGGVPVVRVTDWEAMEISFVTVPADPNSRTRALPYQQDINMPNTNPNESQNRNYSPADRDRIARIGFQDAQERADFLARAAGLDDGAFHRELVNEMARRDQAQPQTFSHFDPGGYGNDRAAGELERAVVDALVARMGGPAPQGRARELAGQSLLQIGNELAQANGVRVDWSSRSRAAETAFATNRDGGARGWLSRRSGGLHAVSDLPTLLSAAGRRVLADRYEAASSPLKVLARKRTAQDFRAITVARLSEMPSLEKVSEHGEITRGSVAEAKEVFKVETFARIFGISRQALLNDDLGAFSDSLAAFGRAAADTEANLLAGLLTANAGAGATMDDGKALFHADHKNRAASGAALSVTALGAARQGIRDAVGLDGQTKLNVPPRYLVVGSDLETVAEQLLGTLYPSQASDAVPEGLRLNLLVDPRMNGLGFRVFSDPSAAECLSYAYLSGAEGPQIEQRDGWDVLGLEIRAVLDFGAGITGCRGAYWTPAA